MNLSNIAVEMRVKNYPSMCRLLDEPILQGNSKVSQMKEWARFIEWERDGHAFVIVGVREAPTPKPLRPDDKYGDSILTCLKWDYARRAHKEGERSALPSSSSCLCAGSWETPGAAMLEN